MLVKIEISEPHVLFYTTIQLLLFCPRVCICSLNLVLLIGGLGSGQKITIIVVITKPPGSATPKVFIGTRLTLKEVFVDLL